MTSPRADDDLQQVRGHHHMWELGNEQCHPVVRLQLCCPAGAEVPELRV